MSDIDTMVVDSLKALDPKRPIREADIAGGQQRPVPLEGNLIKREWFRHYELMPTKGPQDRIVQSWDTATMTGPANDYSVCTTWSMTKNDYYLLDVFRARLQYPDLRRKVASFAGR